MQKDRQVHVGRVCKGAYCVFRIPSSRYAIHLHNTQYEIRNTNSASRATQAVGYDLVNEQARPSPCSFQRDDDVISEDLALFIHKGHPGTGEGVVEPDFQAEGAWTVGLGEGERMEIRDGLTRQP